MHHIKSLNDLKERFGPTRRCFVYTHSTIPYEPLVILHIALTNEISSNIKTVLKSNSNQQVDNSHFTNAIFYSINSCQKGLQQIDLGNALIKTCVHLLLNEMPSLKNFHTLSPIPKFREWIDLQLTNSISYFMMQNETNLSIKKDFFDIEKCFSSTDLKFLFEFFQTEHKANLFENIKAHLRSNEFKLKMSQIELDLNYEETDLKLTKILSQFLKNACAFYLYYEKKNGYSFNSVANFHLKNGAQIYRINFKANLTENGWQSSYGFMVNYGYLLGELDTNCINYLIDKKIKISSLVEKDLLQFQKQ